MVRHANIQMGKEAAAMIRAAITRKIAKTLQRPQQLGLDPPGIAIRSDCKEWPNMSDIFFVSVFRQGLEMPDTGSPVLQYVYAREDRRPAGLSNSRFHDTGLVLFLDGLSMNGRATVTFQYGPGRRMRSWEPNAGCWRMHAHPSVGFSWFRRPFSVTPPATDSPLER